MHRLIPVLLLAACAYVSPLTTARLAAMDPLAADPAGLAVAVVLPAGLAVGPDGVTLDLQATQGEEALNGSYRLTEAAPDPALSVPAGATGHLFTLTPADVTAMRAWQARAAVWQALGSGAVSLGLGLDVCALGAGPPPGAEGAALIRLQNDAPLMPLIGPAPLAALLGPDLMAAIAPCSGPR
ncbi:hypothetical protein MASR2M74_16250 [Paracoccaceae bacterium]